MENTTLIAILVVALALIFAFSNGFNAANIVATVIGTRALTPAQAILMASFFAFVGASLLGTAVAKTMAQGIIDPHLITDHTYGIIIIFATLLSAAGWNILCTILGFPVSASHALIGGLIGAGIVAGGVKIVQWQNVSIIFASLILAPLLALVVAYLMTQLCYLFASSSPPSISKLFRFLEILSFCGFAVSFGANDAPKAMGIITFSLMVLGIYQPVPSAFIPSWVVIACCLAITCGIIFGGKSVIKTVGTGLYKIRHLNGFSAQSSGAVVLYVASIIGLPLSTTHVISGSVMGTGAAERFKAVRWGLSANIFVVWIITLPCSSLMAGFCYFLLFQGANFLRI